MGTFFVYILKTAFFLIVYYLFYKLLLSRETFHRFNRVALVSLLLLSFIFPLAESFLHHGSDNGMGFVDIGDLMTMATVAEDDGATAMSPSHMVIAVLMLVYLVGIVFFMLRSLISYISLARMLRKGEKQTLEDGNTLLLHDDKNAPFSWMHYIVVNKEDMNESGDAIIKHELGHIRNHHTLDLILTEVALILQWFNPAIWLMRRELQAIHEYEADEAVLDQGIDAKSYQLLLIKKAAGSRLQSITNSLHQSSIKKRITMMLKKKSNPWARAKYLLALPVAALSVAVLSTPKASALSNEISECKVSEFFANNQIPGEENAPQAAITIRNDDLNDIVFIVDGKRVTSIDHLNPESIKSIEVLKDEASIAKYADKYDVGNAKGVIIVTSKNPAPTATGKLVYFEDPKQATGAFVVDIAYDKVDEMPEYPGGPNAMMQFIMQNIKYPEQMKNDSIEGRVVLSFVVQKDGSITNVEELQSPHPVLTDEAMRIVKAMPNWKPGKVNGQAVPVKFTLPLSFKLTHEHKESK
jgi:TonB family protein